jgi:hypothetical protein
LLEFFKRFSRLKRIVIGECGFHLTVIGQDTLAGPLFFLGMDLAEDGNQ